MVKVHDNWILIGKVKLKILDSSFCMVYTSDGQENVTLTRRVK